MSPLAAPLLAPSPITSGSLYLKGAGGLAKKQEPKVRDFSLIDRVLDLWEREGPSSLQRTVLPEQVSGPGSLAWETLPPLVHPKAGELPEERLLRKQGQLESLALPCLALAQQGDTIVDFCSGGGHLGLLLAHLLPNCTVHMVENKAGIVGCVFLFVCYT